MSVALHIRLNRAIPIRELTSEAAAVLARLLPGIAIPQVRGRLESGVQSERPMLVADGPNIVFSLQGREEEARLVPVTVPVQEQTDVVTYSIHDEPYVSISWYRAKSDVCWVLVAALAIAAAQLLGERIEDPASFFRKGDAYSAEDMVEALQVSPQHPSIEAASAELVSKMPGMG